MGETNNSEMFAELLAAQQGRLLAFIYALVHNIGDAEDIYQETAIALCASSTAMSRAPTLAPGRKRWLFRSPGFLKRKRRGRVVFDDQLLAKLAGTQAASMCRANPRLQNRTTVRCSIAWTD